jgi:peptidoglycan/xylan/chitin deacetylase (PgdA/CDA1 family)
VAERFHWHGGTPAVDGVARKIVTERLPILMYHRVTSEGAAETARYRVSPGAFEEQLRYLHDSGYRSATLSEWRGSMQARRPLPGRRILLTFDDGYRDFYTEAWPLLERYGFSAIVFLVTGDVGRANRWDATYGDDVPLLTWDEVRRLRDAGVELGSHTATHAHLTALSNADVAREAASSRAVLERELGTTIEAFAYPYGDTDPVVQHLVGACGYVYGLTCRAGPSRYEDSLLALPRIEVEGTDDFADFVRRLVEA